PGGRDQHLIRCINDFLAKNSLTNEQLFKNLKIAIEEDQSFALLLAFCYHYSIGCGRGTGKEAFKYYKIAAEGNKNPFAQCQLGWYVLIFFFVVIKFLFPY